MTTLEIRGLRVSVQGTEILRGIDLSIASGEVHAVMGPNGAGKSTLSAAIMGKPGYEVTDGSIVLDGRELVDVPAWERAALGLHLVMQYPTEVPGVSVRDVLTEALRARGGAVDDVDALLLHEADRINFDRSLLGRSVNVDLSGGEKKRNETVQLAVLKPKVAILDELDSGLDIDALRDCARRVEQMTETDGLGVLAITHYDRLLAELKPDVIHIMIGGRIVTSGGPELAAQLEADGYGAFGVDETSDDPSSSSSLDDLFSL